MVLKLLRSQKQVFHKFLIDEVETIFCKVRQGAENCLNQNLVTGSFLENGIEATLRSRTNVLSIQKGLFSVFCKFSSDKVETVLLESETKRSNLFKSKFGQKKLLSKWFWSNLELKNESSDHLKM